ncbi:hypothetical protein N7492_001485 [Penicillium capsulatum]|uniref:Uncharacterized protein n=1 Tax=Penicillium capsulatum TaxID=69766 RepID=A0A9W9IRP8_9EURO|nr:hypothetical protein N7492_001485 [Penicillium capsulatum]KAJ6129461.1 hypothetical protein N7512_002241 [Penicillium capsulatum]
MQSAPGKLEGVAPTQDRPSTPPPPPYSPLTPVFAQLDPVAASGATIVPPPLSPPTSHDLSDQQPVYEAPRPPAKPAEFKPQPPPVPISESENSDAIALRSAISILQLQKQQSLRDIRTLDRLKEAAAANPEEFAHDLAAGRLRPEDRGAVIQFSDDSMDLDDNPKENDTPAEDSQSSPSSFGRFPLPQKIVRMPPINWAKYSIVGEPFERMHQEQIQRPNANDARQGHAPEHVLAAPYRPLVDLIDHPSQGQSNKLKK